MRKCEPCSVDIWLVQVVQNSSRFQIEANKPHFFLYINEPQMIKRSNAENPLNE